MKIVRTRRGARIVDDDVVLSEILAKPGPTHSLFDLLAAAVATLAPGPRFAMLGFAGGGIVAHNTSLAELESRLSHDPFVAKNVVTAEIVEITPAKTDARLDFLLE